MSEGIYLGDNMWYLLKTKPEEKIYIAWKEVLISLELLAIYTSNNQVCFVNTPVSVTEVNKALGFLGLLDLLSNKLRHLLNYSPTIC